MKKMIIALSSLLSVNLWAINNSEIESSILNANQYLQANDCYRAKQVLDKVGYQHKNADYIVTYAKMHLCEGHFDIRFFEMLDAHKVNEGLDFLPSLTTLETAKSLELSYIRQVSLQSALDKLLYAGDLKQPSHENRKIHFHNWDLAKIENLALRINLILMGHYFKSIGNVDENGLKGAGKGVNKCLIDYITSVGQVARAVQTASMQISPCASDNDGSFATMNGHNFRKQNMCRGVVYFNNFTDLHDNLYLPPHSMDPFIKNMTNSVHHTYLCFDAGLGAVCNTRSQDYCESILWKNNLEAGANVELFFAEVLEVLMTDLN